MDAARIAGRVVTGQPRLWRVIVDPPGEPAANMARDIALLEAVRDGHSPPTIRLYQWNRPAISVGRFQDVRATLNIAFLVKKDVPVVRRPTGGRGVLHGGDITVSLALPVAELGPDGRSVLRSHLRIMAGIGAGLRRLGCVSATGARAERVPSSVGDCFAVTAPSDLVGPSGMKLAGGAQRRIGSAILQQISIPHRSCALSHDQVFAGPISAPANVLADIEVPDLQQAIVIGLLDALRATPFYGSYSERELRAERQLGDGIQVDLGKLM